MTYNRRTVSIITPPANYGVTVADMEAYLLLVAGQDSALLSAFIAASYDAIRQYLRRSIITETLELRMDGFPVYAEGREIALGAGVHEVSIPWLTSGGGREVTLPFGPVASITSLTTYDRGNTATVMSSDDYRADTSRVYLNDAASWPYDLRRTDSVAIRYVSGEATPPAAIIHGIKIHVAAMYECREGCELPPACKAILGAYRRLDPMGF